MENKKVAVYIHRLSDKNFKSGGDKVNHYIIKALIELGFTVDVYFDINDGTNLSVNELLPKETSYSHNKDYLFTIGENFSENKDILYIHENSRHFQDKYTRSTFSKIIRAICQPKRTKYIKERLLKEINATQKSKNVIVPSDIVKTDILEFFKIPTEKIFILPPPVDKQDINFCINNNEVFTFGLSGRGFSNKGGWELITAALLLKLTRHKFKIIIIYPFSKTLRNTEFIIKLLGLSDNITFKEYCENMSKDFYSKINCLVMASKREAFGLVVPEAMNLGIPAIINTRCGVKDFIKDNENGFIYDYEKPVINLFKKMSYVLKNKELCNNMSKITPEIQEELSYEKFMVRFSTILKKLGYLK